VPGIGPDLAARIVKIRDRAGGFSSLEDFATLLDLPRDQVDALRGALLFSA
jgi:DNA uptake protein ComE-like DNA-binding protein